MNISTLIFFLTGFTSIAYANPCVVVGSSVEVSMTDAMIADLKIPSDVIKNIEMQEISETKVSDTMALSLAMKKFNPRLSLPLKEMIATYTENNVKNLIVKYTYTNREGKKNIMLGSSLVNDNECSVDFIGYLIVEQNF